MTVGCLLVVAHQLGTWTAWVRSTTHRRQEPASPPQCAGCADSLAPCGRWREGHDAGCQKAPVAPATATLTARRVRLCPGRWALPMELPPTAIPSPLCPVLRSPPRTARCPPALPAPPSAGRFVLSSPSSRGRRFHWQPLRIRKMMLDAVPELDLPFEIVSKACLHSGSASSHLLISV